MEQLSRHGSHLFELITRRLDTKSVDQLSGVSKDIFGRVRMKYFFNYGYCMPPAGSTWWALADETAVTLEVCEDCFRDYLEASLEEGSPVIGKATKGFCVSICGVPAVIVLSYRYRAEVMGGPDTMRGSERSEKEDRTLKQNKGNNNDAVAARDDNDDKNIDDNDDDHLSGSDPDEVGQEGSDFEDVGREADDLESLHSARSFKQDGIYVTDLIPISTRVEWGTTSSQYQRFYYTDDVSIASDSTISEGSLRPEALDNDEYDYYHSDQNSTTDDPVVETSDWEA